MKKTIIMTFAVVGMMVSSIGWGIGLDDFEFTMEEKARVENGAAVLTDIDFTDAAGYVANSTVTRLTEDEVPFVRITGIGSGNGVEPATNCAVTPCEVIYIDLTTRVAECGDSNTEIIYIEMYDANNKRIQNDQGASSGWSFSVSSATLVRYPLQLSVANEWVLQSYRMVVPQGVYAIKPQIAMWRGDHVDCRRLTVRTTGSVFVTRSLTMGTPMASGADRLRYQPANENLQIDIRYETTNRQHLITATVTDLNPNVVKRCFDLHLKWKRNLAGWTWHKDWMNDTTIAAGNSYLNTSTVGGFPVSKYAITAVSSPSGDERYLFGTPLDEKAYERREITASGIESSQPLGIWVRGDRGRENVFRWIFAEFEGDWGFRSAMKEYLRTQSVFMPAVGVGKVEGTWIWPESAMNVENHEDFGLHYWEAGRTWTEKNVSGITQAQKRGIAAFPYIEPWGMRVTIGAANVYDKTGLETPAETYARAAAWATNESEQAYEWNFTNRQVAAQAWLNSLPQQPNGEYAFGDDYYDSWARWWRTVPDPQIAHPNVFDLSWYARTSAAHELMDGIYLDSVSYYDYRNEREEHLNVFTHPLIYDTEMLRPCSDGMQHMCDCISYIASELHPKDKRVWGNTFGMAYRFNVDTIDIYGCEVGTWGSNNNTNVGVHARMMSDAEAGFQRFYAYHRPIVNLLQDGSWTKLTPETPKECVLAYIENHMLYGFYPSVTTIGGEEEGDGYGNWKRYFDSRKRYERDRDIFKAAIPVIQRMNAAGWEPETGLVANTNVVRIERYGSGTKAELLFAVHNDSDKPVTTRLNRAAAEGVDFVTLTPIYHGETLSAAEEGWTMELAPWQTAVVKGEVRTLDKTGRQEVVGSGCLQVTAAVELSGAFDGDLYVAEGASVKFGDCRAIPVEPPVMESGAENILWFDPSQSALMSFEKPSSETAAGAGLVLKNAANPGWYDLKGGARSAAVVNRAVENGGEIPWLDYDVSVAGGVGSTMRFNDSSTATNHNFNARSVFMVLDTRGGGGNPLIDTALAGYPGCMTYLCNRSKRTSPVLLANNQHDFVTNSLAFLNARLIEQGKEAFNACGEVLSVVFDEELPIKAFGNFGDTGSNFLRHGEVLLYQEELTTQQRRDTEAYLMYKWLGKIAGGYGTFTNLVVHGTGTVTLPANRECWPIIGDDFFGTIVVEEAPLPREGTVWTLPNVEYGETFAIQMTNVVTMAASNDTIRILPGRHTMGDVYMWRGGYATSGGEVESNVHIYPNGKVLHFEGDSVGHWDGQVELTGNGCFYKCSNAGDDGTTFEGLTFKGFRASEKPNATPTDGNLTTDCMGGAIRGTSGIMAENCVFEENVARVGGAVVTMTCRDCQFVGNNAAYAGGASYGGHFTACEFDGNYASGSGGALWWPSTVNDCTFLTNHARAAGAVCTIDGNVFSNCVFRGNYSSSAGGALQLRRENRIVDCVFEGNYAPDRGGAIYGGPTDNTGNGGHQAVIKRCVFRGNYTARDSCAVDMQVCGGAVYCEDINMSASPHQYYPPSEVSDCVFEGNRAWDGGGAIYGGRLVNCEFIENTCLGTNGQCGVAIYNDQRPSNNCEVVGCRFVGNHITGSGAKGKTTSIVEMGSTGQVRDCWFERNFVTNTINYANNCGILRNGRTSGLTQADVIGCTFVSNTVWNGGIVRGFFCADCDFIENEVPLTGGIVYLSKAVGCRLRGNRKWDYLQPTKVTRYSGALNASSPSGDGNQSTFVGCTMDGGVLTRCVLDRCVIPSCTNAGAYCVFYGGGNFVTNTLITGKLGCPDSGSLFRGVIYDWGSAAAASKYVNCTFADLTVVSGVRYGDEGGFLHRDQGSVYPIDFINCIFHGYQANGVTNDLKVVFAAPASGQSGISVYNCMAGVFTNASVGVEWSNFEDNLTVAEADQQLVLTDEEMVAAGMPCYAPMLTSPACKAGNPSGYTDVDTDLAGVTRVCSGTVDLGCYQAFDINIRPNDMTITIPVHAEMTNTLAQALDKAGLTCADLNGGAYSGYAIIKQGEGTLVFPSMDDGEAVMSGWCGDLLIREGVLKVKLPENPSDKDYTWLLGTNTVGKVEVSSGAALYIESYGDVANNYAMGIARPIHIAGEGTADYPGALTILCKGSHANSYRRSQPYAVYLDDDATICFLKGGNATTAQEGKPRFLCGHTLTLKSLTYSPLSYIATGSFNPGETLADYNANARTIFDNVTLHSRTGNHSMLFGRYLPGNEIRFRNNAGYCYNGNFACGERWAMIFEKTASWVLNDNAYAIAGCGISTNGASTAYGPVVLDRDLTISYSSYNETAMATKDHNTGFLGPISGVGGLTMSAQDDHPYANAILNLAGDNTFTGPLTLTGITLALFNERSIPRDANLVTLKNCEVVLCYDQTAVGELRFPETVFEGAGRLYAADGAATIPAYRVSFGHLTKNGAGTLTIDARLFGGALDIRDGTVKLANVDGVASAVDALGGSGTLDLGGGVLKVGSVDYSQGLQVVNGSIMVCSDFRLVEAVNAEDLAWATSGDAAWLAEWTTTAADGVHAVRSGVIGDNQSSELTLRLEGAGQLAFDWRVSCEDRHDFMLLKVDGSTKQRISGNVGWTNVVVELGAGSHTVRWIYRKGSANRAGEDAAWLDNVTWTAATPPSSPTPALAEALDDELVWETDGDAEWAAVNSAAFAAVGDSFAWVSGLGVDDVATIRTQVSGAGRLEFRWAVSCVEDYDWLDFNVDGECWAMATGETEWLLVTVNVGEGDHTFEWIYWKNEPSDESSAVNCAMLDGVIWTPSENAHPELREVSLVDFYAWLRQYGLLAADAPSSAALSMATAATANKSTTLIEEYIAGTNPTNSTDTFQAFIAIDEGKPVVTWNPDLNGDCKREGNRAYHIYATNILTDDESWVEIDETQTDQYQFFKVTVEMPVD